MHSAKRAYLYCGYLLAFGARVALCCVVLCCINAHGVSINPEVKSQNLAQHIYWLEDKTHNLSFEHVKGLPLSNFNQNQHSRFNKGYSKSSYWLRFDVDYHNAEGVSWLLDISYSLLDYITFYEPTEAGLYRAHRTRDRVPFSMRDLDVNTFLFPLNPKENTQRYYLHIKTQDSFQVPVVLWQEKYYPAAYASKMMWHGVYLGAMLIIILYNSFIFITTRSETYLFYILSVTSITLFLMGANGFNYQFLWPESPWWANISIPFFGGLFATFGSLFVRSILRTERLMPKIDKYLKLFILGLVLSVPLILVLPYSWGVQLAMFNALVFSLVSFFTVLYGALKGGRTAKILLLAWSICIVLLFIAILGNMGILKLSGYGPYIVQYASFIEAVIFSLTLADRIKQPNKDKKDLTRLSVDALAEGNQYLLDSIKLKDEFIATITHEIRTPMNAILGSSLLLQDSKLDSSQSKYLKIIDRSGNSLLKIINDVLDYSKLESKKIHIKNENVSIETCVIDVVNDVSDRYWEKGVPIYVHMSPDLPSQIISDKDRLKQLLFNILDNACKFTDFGQISIKVFTEENNNTNYLRIQVVDTGVGIKAEHMGNLYEGFTQADSSISRRYGGTGLGLAISYRLCALMKGELSIKSVYGQGTHVNMLIKFESFIASLKPKDKEDSETLEVGVALSGAPKPLMVELLKTLPVHVSIIDNNDDLNHTNAMVVFSDLNTLSLYSGYDAKKMVLLASKGSPDNGLSVLYSPYTPKSVMEFLLSIQKRNDVKSFDEVNQMDFSSLHVLAVDDDATNRMIISSVLKRYKIKADIAESGGQALKMATQIYGQYDLILMDLEMPGMNGYEATTLLRSFEREHLLAPTQIVALSAHSIEEFKGLAIASGMNDFMNKPIKKQKLEALLNNVLMEKML